MGPRHKIFVVARVVPHNSTDKRAVYRCVAALYMGSSVESLRVCRVIYPNLLLLTSSYGRHSLKALRRFLTLIKHPVNAKVIRQELQVIQGKYGAYGKKKPTIPEVPCPYITFLLASAWHVSLEDGINLNTHAISARVMDTLDGSE